ncbi:YciI family protein [Actinomadura opuntiae]|uniref:YciI family protein n=1 Tax=Actinomadura sp. OS1-43 TaxID=604315 RepID=UPI00255B3FD1|nr:YciI family protein [Actinomadura sp. OS1-43]MDL4816922.1 YciI family protein [Actinomadura sp. OS1-43]
MKHYLLSIQQPDGDPPPPEILEPITRDLAAFNRELQDAGAWVFAGGLHLAHNAVVARPEAGEVLITDGPYAEGKEHVGGLSIIRAPDLDTALEWARKLARATTLPVELREFQALATDGSAG